MRNNDKDLSPFNQNAGMKTPKIRFRSFFISNTEAPTSYAAKGRGKIYPSLLVQVHSDAQFNEVIGYLHLFLKAVSIKERIVNSIRGSIGEYKQRILRTNN